MTQLVLDLGLPEPAWKREERQLLRLGILRHGRDLTSHQRGWCVLDWDTAGRPEPYSSPGGLRKGDLVPAWVCCQCRVPELSQFSLELNHSCGNNHPDGCTSRRLGGRRWGRARFARPVHAQRVWGRFLPPGARRPEVVRYRQVRP